MSKVLLVTNIFPPQIGGPATFIDRLARSLADRDHRVTVVCSSSDRHDPSDAERPFAVRRVSTASRERYEVMVRARLALEMARHRLIFVNGLERYVSDVNRLLHKRYILKIVGDAVWETARNRGITDLSIDDFQADAQAQVQCGADIHRRNRWVSGASRIVVPSNYLQRLVEGWGVPHDRITVVRNGTAISEMPLPRERHPNERLRALFVGRLTNWKGVETLMLAARHLPDLEVEIVGDGPEWPHLIGLSRQLCVEDRVIFRGRLGQDGVRRAMARAHVLVLTSLYEGLSHTVLEAFSAGLPCVVSDRGGNEEVVINGKNGLVVPPQNVTQLVYALGCLIANEPLRRALASTALETVRAFDLSETVTKTERLLLEVA